MARSFETIRDSIIAEKNTKPSLDVLDSTSNVSIWRLFIDVIAESIRVTETFFDSAVADINVKIAEQILGTPSWYKLKCLEFQVGDDLQDDGTYAVVDLTKRIVTRAAVVEGLDGVLTIKVAKGLTGAEVSLSNVELNQFTTYMQRVKFAGTVLNIVSLNADKLRLTGTIYHDGIYSTATMQARVQTALETFMSSDLTFNGNILNNLIINRLQTVEGLNDVFFSEVKGISGIIETTFTREYATFSGYIKESTTPGERFIDTLTYVAQVSE
jgi:hypothetical protein